MRNGALGAELGGVDLETIDDATFEQLADAVWEHQVVFLRGQHLSEDGHRALAERFGTPSVFPIAAHFGGTEIFGIIEDDEDRRPKADGWHTDVTWIVAPPQVAILCALDIPPYGGDTMWADLNGAWDALSPAMQQVPSGLRVRHRPGDGFWQGTSQMLPPEQVRELQAAFPGAEDPLVRTHPITGRTALFVAGDFMASIVGQHPEESDLLLGWLRSRVENPNLQVRWQWTAGDVAIWERATNHRALSGHWPQHRRMRRCTVDGERPPDRLRDFGMLLGGINHVGMLTGDTERFLEFYGGVFDATHEVLQDHDGFKLTLVWVGPSAELNVFELSDNTEHERQTPMFGRGRLDHLALEAASLEAFDEIRGRLLERGATDGFVTDFGHLLSLFFRDPDGLEAEVCVPNPDAEPGVHNPPGTPSMRYHAPGTPPPARLADRRRAD